MNEAKIALGPKWKNKYRIDWCRLCRTAHIVCPDCFNTTCNCGGCPKCDKDFKEFDEYKTRVEDYLTDEEIKIYHKCEKLKDFIIYSIQNGQKEIDFTRLLIEDKYSEITEEMFKDKIDYTKITS